MNEVTEVLLTLKRTPTADKAAAAPQAVRRTDVLQGPGCHCAELCASMETTTELVDRHRQFWSTVKLRGCSGLHGQRASEPCAPSVLRRTRAALAFYEEASGCTWFARQADALESGAQAPTEGRNTLAARVHQKRACLLYDVKSSC